MAKRPPPPPPRRGSAPLEKLCRIEARHRQGERPFEPEEAPERYARAHHFAVNPGPEGIQGERADFHSGTTEEILEQAQRYGSWSSNPNGEWFIPDRLSGSDYSGGFVAKANFKAFVDEWADHDPPFFTELYGGHSTYGVAIHIGSAPDEVWEQLAQLEQYPLLDDDLHTQLEEEGKNEAWERWACDEYKQLWEQALEDDETLPEGWVDLISDDDWRQHFEECAEAANIYWEPQGDTPEMGISVQDVFDSCDEAPPVPGLSGAEPSEEPDAPAGASPVSQPSAFDEPQQSDARRRQIEQLKAELDRPYRRFEPNARDATLAEWLAKDPYAGVSVGMKGAYYDYMYAWGSVMHNVLHDVDPHEEAALVMRAPDPDRTPLLVIWYGRAPRKDMPTAYYTVWFIDVEQIKKVPVFSVGRVAEVGSDVEVPEQFWDDVLLGLHAALRGSTASEDLAALVLYLFWYAEPGTYDPPLGDYSDEDGHAPIRVRHDVPAHDFEFAWHEVFGVHAARSQQVEEIMAELGMGRRELAPPPPPPVSLGPSLGELAAKRRREQIEYARRQLDRPFPRRFEPNRADLPTAPDQDVNAYLAADPYQSSQSLKDIVVNGPALGEGYVLHNVTHESHPQSEAILLVGSGAAGSPHLVMWNRVGDDSYEYFVLPVPLPAEMIETGEVIEVRRSSPFVDPNEWDKVIVSMLQYGGADATAIYFRWWTQARSGLDVLPAVYVEYEMPGARLREAFAEVFAIGDALEESGSVGSLRTSRTLQAATRAVAPEPPPARGRWWLEGPDERPPLGRYSPKQIAAFKARGMIPGYHFNPLTPNDEYSPFHEQIPGGLAAGMVPEQFDPEQLAIGTEVELEHAGGNVMLAREIAMDHLVEDSMYYQKLRMLGL